MEFNLRYAKIEDESEVMVPKGKRQRLFILSTSNGAWLWASQNVPFFVNDCGKHYFQLLKEEAHEVPFAYQCSFPLKLPNVESISN